MPVENDSLRGQRIQVRRPHVTSVEANIVESLQHCKCVRLWLGFLDERERHETQTNHLFF